MISAIECEKELDAGAIYLKQPLSLKGSAEEIFDRASNVINKMIIKIIETNPEPIPQLGELLKLDSITTFTDQKEWFTKRDEIKKMIGNWLIKQSTQYWLDILQPADIWCAEVLEWDKMMQNDGFKVLDMLQRIKRFDGLDIETLRCPIRINNEVYKSDRAAPVIGQHTKQIIEEFNKVCNYIGNVQTIRFIKIYKIKFE